MCPTPGRSRRRLRISRRRSIAGRNSADLPSVTLFADLENTIPGVEVEKAAASIGADTIAKFLFTSGSTSLPKGVINTHGMLTANQQQSVQTWPFLEQQDVVLVDWLPWNHTFGSNYTFNLVMQQAGTLYIDGGKPVPALIGQTVQNLRDIAPTIDFNVPAGYGALLPYLESDEALARNFFSKLRVMFYAGAALPQDMWDRLEAISIRTTGMRVPLTSGWGTTETSPLATMAHWLFERAGVIGVPVRRCRHQARACRKQTRNSRARTKHHAGLLAQARSDAGAVRRGGLLPPRRCGALR